MKSRLLASFLRSSDSLRSGLLAVSLCLITVSASAQLVSTVVMSGLQNPRGIAVGPEGALYVTEAGSPFTVTAATPSIIMRGMPFYYGNTGAISRLDASGQSRIVNGLPMLFSPTIGDFGGADGIGFSPAGDLYFTVGIGTNPNSRTAATPGLGVLMRLPGASGTPQFVADVSAFEAANNPAGGPLDSNPFHISVRSDHVLIADAGANAILKTTFAGVTSLVTTVPPLPSGAEGVPTSIVVGPDGSLYGGQLTGFPFPVGGASIFKIESGSATPIVSGFSTMIDMAFGPNGLLYVLEHTHFGFLSGNSTGGLWEVDPFTGEKRLLMSDGLVRPTALALGDDGTIYVANYGVMPGQGQVLALTSAIPEPSTYGLLAAAALLGIALRKKMRSRALTSSISKLT